MKITVIPRSQIKDTGKNFARVFFSDKTIDGCFVIDKEGGKTLEIRSLPKEKINRRNFILLIRQIIFTAKQHGIKKLKIDWLDVRKFSKSLTDIEAAEIAGTNFEMANYEFLRYKSVPGEKQVLIEEIIITTEPRVNKNSLQKTIDKGMIIGREVNASRELSNTPGGDMTPELLVSEIKKSIQGTKIKIKVLEEADMEKLGMGAILGVAKGSSAPAKFIIMEYAGKKEKNPTVLIGKGVTYDSGGLNIKSSEGLSDMNMDMSGGAAVAYAVIAAAKLGIKKRIIGLIPAVENMLSGKSYRPGDILRSMSGQTIEIQNTDAEGRIILADANTYAERYKPKLVINVATLTGAAEVALGQRASAIFSKNKKLLDLFCESGEKSGDYVWPMPLWDEYEAEIKGNFGDISNTKTQGLPRGGGAILGALFVYQFAKKFPEWVHIDMAPRMLTVFDEFLSKGSSGAPIRLLVNFLENYK